MHRNIMKRFNALLVVARVMHNYLLFCGKSKVNNNVIGLLSRNIPHTRTQAKIYHRVAREGMSQEFFTENVPTGYVAHENTLRAPSKFNF